MRTAVVVIPLAGNVRPRSKRALDAARLAFGRLTELPIAGPIQFTGYDPGRAARYLASFEDA